MSIEAKSPRSPARHGTPQYIAIADEIAERISLGLFGSNQLPTFKELAAEFDVSLVTINEVIKELASRGLIVRKRGKGTFLSTAHARPAESLQVGLLVPDVANPYFASLARAIGDGVGSENGVVITQSSGGSLTKWNESVLKMADHGVSGLILIPLELKRTEQERALWQLKIRNIPFVYLDDHFPRVPSDHVVVDIESGVREVADHLCSLGHRRIACVSAEPYIEITRVKIETFREALRARGMVLGRDDVIIGTKRHDAGGEEAAEALLGREQRPTAIFATNDIIAAGVLRAARRHRVAVPSELSVVGFDGIDLVRFLDPPLTTMEQPVKELARSAFRILHQRIMGTLPTDFQQEVFAPNLVVRGSTAPPP